MQKKIQDLMFRVKPSSDKNTLPDLLMKSIRELGGDFSKDALGLFSVMRDEMWFLPAFLDHYRHIGVEQFVIWDDASTDGTREHLLAQPDVLVLESDYKFGEIVNTGNKSLFDSFSRKGEKQLRAGRAYKEIIPQIYFDGNYGLYVDADEFLFLPPGVTSLRQVVDRLKSTKADCVAASLVEFFPKDLSGLEDKTPPTSLNALLERYPFFEARPILELRKGEQAAFSGASKTTELFSRYPSIEGKHLKSPVLKTPIVHHSTGNRRDGSHFAVKPPASDLMLTMAHFVFTGQFKEKISRAKEWQSHVRGGQKYYKYAEMLKQMERNGDSFEGPHTARFENVRQFLDAGLMLW